MEHVEIDRKEDKGYASHIKRKRYQKGRYRHIRQGMKRNVHVSGWSRRRTKGRRDNFWTKVCKQCTPDLHTPRLVSWESENAWKPLLDPDYSEVFSTYCDKYPHYFDAAKGSFGIDDE